MVIRSSRLPPDPIVCPTYMESMSKPLLLGIRAWINNNYDAAFEADLVECDLQPADFQRLLELAECTRAELEEKGRRLKQQGAHYTVGETSQHLGTQDVSLYYGYQSGWADIDVTMPRGPEDERTRYVKGPDWCNNSCALDSVLMVLIWLRAWRLSIDQLDYHSSVKLTNIVQLTRSILAFGPWGSVLTEERTGLRDALRDSLYEIEPKSFPKRSFMSAIRVFETIAIGLPQLSFTMGKAHFCCDQKPGVPARFATKRVSGLLIEISEMDSTLEVALNHKYAQPLSHDFQIRRCSRQASCTQTLTKQWMILDRAPPTIAIGFNNDRQKFMVNASSSLGIFDPLTISFLFRTGIHSITYRPRGAILYLPSDKHFVARWRFTDDLESIREHDGMKGEDCIRVGSWEKGLPPDAQVSIMIYTLYEAGEAAVKMFLE